MSYALASQLYCWQHHQCLRLQQQPRRRRLRLQHHHRLHTISSRNTASVSNRNTDAASISESISIAKFVRMVSLSASSSASLRAPSSAIEAFPQSSASNSHGIRSSQRVVRLETKASVQRLSRGSCAVMSTLTTCNTTLGARCSAEQQTVQNPVATKSPVQARQKENLPKLDDSGPGGGPGRGDGGGGGGGGGGGWAGGFFLWGFLMLVAFIRDKEKDKPYRQGALTKSKLKRMRQAQM